MAVNDIVGLRIVGRYQDQNIVNTLFYKILQQDEGEDSILQFLGDLWESTLKTEWLARHVGLYSLIGIRAFNVVGVNKVPGITHIDDPGILIIDEMLSPVCRTITLYTESTNYRRHGRVMLSGGAANMFNSTDGAVTTTEITELWDLGTALITILSQSNNEFQPGLAPTDVLPFEPFTAFKARRTPAVIRSRRVRGLMIG